MSLVIDVERSAAAADSLASALSDDEALRAARFVFERDLGELVWVNETTKTYADAAPPEIGLGRPFDG